MSTDRQFGTFFRAKRKALGLTLREFCRRNGFDPGNVSRLERGLAAPPQTQEALSSYAEALKLKRGTDAWDTFFELAAAETGRIPPSLLEDRGTAQRLPDLFRQLRSGGERRTNWVRALHLETWADSLDARRTLPQLVRRLVAATGKGITRTEFPAGEQVQRPGWDGIVEAGGQDAFVPAGTSGWEMGVDENPKAKARDDLKKRTKDPRGLDPRKTTFVFVTPRKCQWKGEWCRAQMESRTWREVRVYDSAALEEWLERAPAVDVWLARILGLRPEGVTEIDEYWANIQALTEPALKPEVFLTSRDEQVKELGERLKGSSAATVIAARSPSDAVDFVAAYSRAVPEAESLTARTLIVESKDAWRALATTSDSELILIAHPALAVEPEMVAEAVRRGHRVLLPRSETAGEEPGALKLPRAYRYDLEKALVASGLEEEAAGRAARESGGSLAVLKRLLGRFPGTSQPDWCQPANAAPLIPMLLAGSWYEGSDGDRSALEKLAGQPYAEIAAVAERWRKAPDPPLVRTLARVALVSRDDSWFLLAPSLTADHLARFAKVALEVLGEDDPAYDLPPDQRWLAGLHKKVPRHSQTLRTGLAETLALLAARPERVSDSLGLKGRVEQVVQTLLDGQDWKRWASLSPQLPLFAEAGPEAFLDAVERDLKRAEPALVRLFEPEGAPFFSSSPHTGLLWALENLAWDSQLLSRVSLILAWLDEHDPGGSPGNCPARSLQEIFIPWLPQTTASVDERVKVLAALARRRPVAGWRLLQSLLPNRLMASTPTHRPTWRDWSLRWSKGAPPAEYWHQVSATAHLLVEHIGDDLGRWKALIDQLENLPEPARGEFLAKLNALDVAALDIGPRRELVDALREKVSTHREYADAEWALPAEVLAELERVRTRFEPEDAVARNAWLFGPGWKVGDRLEGREERIAALRSAALQEVLAQAGWEGVLALVREAEAPEAVGVALGWSGADYEATILPGLLVSADEKVSRFARGFVLGRHGPERWEWVGSLDPNRWSPEELGRVLLDLRFERRTWDLAAAKGEKVCDYYWRHARGFVRGTDASETAFAVSMFLRHKRPAAAFDVIGMALHQKTPLEPALLLEALEAARDPRADEREVGRHGVHDIHLIFQELQRRVKVKEPEVNPERVARLEWAYLNLLNGRPASPEVLHSMLRDNADFFVDLLGLIFRSRHEPDDARKEVTEQERARGQNAYKLLFSWHTVPGSDDQGAVDERAVLAWVKRARALAEERGLLEVCDSRIGEVFAWDRERPGEAWPSVAVRDAMEEVGTDELLQGFSIGIFNKRGMYWKSPTEGGAKERALAQKYREFAEASKIEWPKTAAALRRVTERYEEDARREDETATLDT